MASHGLGKSVRLPATLPPPLPDLPSPPSSISPHNLSTPSCIWLSSRACLSFNKSLYQEQVGGFMYVPASHLQTWSPQNAPPEYVLLEGFCPFPVWIGECAARQNGPLSAKRATLPTDLEHVINVYTCDCHLGLMERIDYLFELVAKHTFNLKLQT